MPSPRDQQNRRRRQESMPGGWLWVVVVLLLGVVLYITFGIPSTGTIDYSDFQTLVKEKKVAKVALREGSYSLVAEVKETEVDKLPEAIKKQVRNNRVEVLLWKGDVDSGEVSRLLEKNEIPRKTEREMTAWIGPIFTTLLIMLFFAAIIFFVILPRFRDPFGSNFLNNYIRSPAKRYDKTKMHNV